MGLRPVSQDRPALLDVNLLVALFDPDHVHHELAHDWFGEHHHLGWTTCPVTENGFVRVLSNPTYRSPIGRLLDLIERLSAFCSADGHHFWPDTVSTRDGNRFDAAMIAGHRQLTDIYLLGLAHSHGGYLATFDRRIPVKAVVGATRDTLLVIEPADA